MLNSSQVSLIMSDMQGLLIAKLEKEGFIFPSIFIMNEKSIIHVDDLMSKYSCIVNIEYSNDHYGAYVTRMTLRNRDEKDDEAILEIVREITFRHQPDAVGYFAQCLYKPMSREEYNKLTTDSMNLDPEAIRVFHNCFFVKGEDKRGTLMVTPYKLSENNKEDPFNLDDTSKFTVTEFHRAWEVPTATLETRIPNPYL